MMYLATGRTGGNSRHGYVTTVHAAACCKNSPVVDCQCHGVNQSLRNSLTAYAN